MNNNFLPYQLKKNAEQNSTLATQMAQKTTDLQGRGINPLFPPAPLVACKGDGTDDSTALQAIINYCQTNNARLISPSGKTYGISSPLLITNAIKMDFGFSTIKALSSIDSVINYNTNARDTFIDHLVIDCNLLTNYGIYMATVQMARIEHIVILNVSKTGLHMNSGYELFASHIRIQGNGTSTTIGINAYGDSHFSHINMLDCYNAIYTRNYSFFDNIHAWLSSSAQITGSMFMGGSGGGSFNQIYSDTYYYAFAPNSNTNYLNINEAYVFSNPTIYTSTATNQAPSLFYFSNVNQTAMVSITNSTMWAISSSSGFANGGIFMNQPLYQWQGKMHNCMLTGIQSVPDNIVSSLTLGTGWTVGNINRLTKRNGRVHLELDCYYSGSIPSGTSVNICSFGNGGFPDGFYPKDSKKLMVAIGAQWSFKEVCYAYLTASYDHSSLAITYAGATSNLTYITIDIEYEAVNSI